MEGGSLRKGLPSIFTTLHYEEIPIFHMYILYSFYCLPKVEERISPNGKH